MAAYSIKRYSPEDKERWDCFIQESINANFLFFRDYMEYHSDRFNDYSLLIYKKNKPVALLPAHQKEKRIYSHQGLTYGGFIFRKYLKTTSIEKILTTVFKYLKEEGGTELVLKLMPVIYQQEYSSAVEYFLFQKHAQLIRRDLNFVRNLRHPLKIHKSKRKIYNKDFIEKLSIKKDDALKPFWQKVLTPVLAEKHDAEPIHSLEEIEQLQRKFPQHIQQVNVYFEDEVIAGLTLFVNKNVVKSQYGAATHKGQEYRALDFLYQELFKYYNARNFLYFDLGTTTENSGWNYKTGLTTYKEELGGGSVNQDQYLLQL